MAERRSLIEGIVPSTPPVDPNVEKAFVFGNKPEVVKLESLPTTNRTPLSTRIRTDLAAALKKESLERQINNVHPQTVQEILEEAIEAWLGSR